MQQTVHSDKPMILGLDVELRILGMQKKRLSIPQDCRIGDLLFFLGMGVGIKN